MPISCVCRATVYAISPHYYNTEDDIDRSSPIVALDDERAASASIRSRVRLVALRTD